LFAQDLDVLGAGFVVLLQGLVRRTEQSVLALAVLEVDGELGHLGLALGPLSLLGGDLGVELFDLGAESGQLLVEGLGLRFEAREALDLVLRLVELEVFVTLLANRGFEFGGELADLLSQFRQLACRLLVDRSHGVIDLSFEILLLLLEVLVVSGELVIGLLQVAEVFLGLLVACELDLLVGETPLGFFELGRGSLELILELVETLGLGAELPEVLDFVELLLGKSFGSLGRLFGDLGLLLAVLEGSRSTLVRTGLLLVVLSDGLFDHFSRADLGSTLDCVALVVLERDELSDLVGVLLKFGCLIFDLLLQALNLSLSLGERFLGLRVIFPVAHDDLLLSRAVLEKALLGSFACRSSHLTAIDTCTLLESLTHVVCTIRRGVALSVISFGHL